MVWGFEELVAGASATVQLTTLPVEVGRPEGPRRSPLGQRLDGRLRAARGGRLPSASCRSRFTTWPTRLKSAARRPTKSASRIAGPRTPRNVAISVDFPARPQAARRRRSRQGHGQRRPRRVRSHRPHHARAGSHLQGPRRRTAGWRPPHRRLADQRRPAAAAHPRGEHAGLLGPIVVGKVVDLLTILWTFLGL